MKCPSACLSVPVLYIFFVPCPSLITASECVCHVQVALPCPSLITKSESDYRETDYYNLIYIDLFIGYILGLINEAVLRFLGGYGYFAYWRFTVRLYLEISRLFRLYRMHFRVYQFLYFFFYSFCMFQKGTVPQL